MARVHVAAWQQTYRGQMRDAELDDPRLPERHHRMWTAILTDPQHSDRTAAVAEVDSRIVGIAMSGPPRDTDATWARQLYVLYVLNPHHGTGVAAQLIEAVLEPTTSAALWVADPNPRAQAFYNKHGFRPDGAVQVDHGVREIRMNRVTSTVRTR